MKRLFKLKTLYIFTLVLLVGSIMFRIQCSNVLAVKNTELRGLYEQKAYLEKEISKLDYINSELTSLAYVEDKASQLGYVELHDALISLKLNSPTPVAVVSKE